MLTKMQSGEDFAVQTKGGGRIVVPNVVAEPQFNPTSAYAVDAKVWYGSVQYVCTTATTAPAEGQSNPTPEEDTAHWTELPVEEMAKRSEIPSIPVAPVHELFLNARADVWLSAGDGDDANDGLAPDRAVKSIARAYAAAKAAVDAQTLDGSRQVVVAVDEGVYAAAMITSELASGIRYLAVGDRERTLVMPMGGTYGPSEAYETAMACVNGEHPRVFEMEGFTFTGFNGNHHLAIAQYQSGIVYGMTLRRCLITGNSPICTKAFVCGTFIDCDITGNTTRPAGNTGGDAPFGGSSAVYDDRERYQTRMYSCHVWDNDFSTFQYFANKIEAKQCLFENSFAAVKAIHGEHNTMIADRYTNPLIPPSSTYKKFFAMGAKYFAVIASSADSTSDPFYVETDAYVCVQTANLTEDKVAADASCPSVRSDGSLDFGYRDSGLGRKKTADGKATKSDATLTERGFSEWTITATNPAFPGPYSLSWNANQSSWEFYSGSTLFGAVYNSSATAVSATLTQAESTYVATRTALQGYQLGAQTDKPLASEAEAEALRTEAASKLNKSGGTITGNLTIGENGSSGYHYLRLLGGGSATFVGGETDSNGNLQHGIRVDFQSGGDYIPIYVYKNGSSRAFNLPFAAGTSARLENIASDFSASVSYVCNALVLYASGGDSPKLYRCVNPNGHTGNWNPNDFQEATVEDILAALRTDKADRAANPTAGNLAALDAQGNPTDSGIAKTSVVKIPAYNGQNREYVTSEGGGDLSSWLSTNGATESTMAHGPWTMPRSGIIYVQLQQVSDTYTSVRIGVNGKPVKIENGSVVVDYDYQVVECRVAAKSDVVYPLFLNAGDKLYMRVYNTALSKISLSAIFYP